MREAITKHTAFLNRQSKTFDAAVAEYKRRYKMDPPKGFDEWWSFAVENDVKVIDDYDNLMRDLAPFRALSGEEIRRRVYQVGHLPSIDLVRLRDGVSSTLNIQNGFNDSEVSARAKGFRVMIEKFQHTLPDLDFPINAKAEGRVLVPWEHVTYPNTTSQDTSEGVEAVLGGPFIPDWRGDGNVWEAYRRTCDPSTQARRLFGSLRAQLKQGQAPISRFEAAGIAGSSEDDFKFAKTVDDKFDFCAHPWARYQQGHFFSDWRTVPVLYPIFSPAKGQGFSDIMIPSHYYYSSTKKYTYGWDPITMVVNDVDVHETPWEKKSDLIFWRGATTGGGSNPPGFVGQYQRHRFIRMISDHSDANRTVVIEHPKGSDKWQHVKVPVANMNDDFTDAGFVKAVGCQQYPGGCAAMQKDMRFADPVPLGYHWHHKYLVDFDGMGYSARLFAFLASDSAVIKSTIYTEFFSEWIQPWLHYIPLTMSYKEIYNIHAYFSGPTKSMLAAANITEAENNPPAEQRTQQAIDRDNELRKIAQAGRQWKYSIGRKVDMETYVYRLCLEWARLYMDDRDAYSFKG
ncbi:hypothetical protein BKA62DRAFT_740679 [Auriculariales sp. MPI-PUGE-AT-0066]|nr:hypothetical protein BKA62DRAFT_740679 [Auriculariales sp. MPI-PUGE-AT-0066]